MASALPSAAARRKRILEAALRGERGKDWYLRAENEIKLVARAWGVSPTLVAVAVAGTSPATPVIASPRMTRGGGTASNIGKARRVVKAWQAGRSYASVMPAASPGATRLKAFEDCGLRASCLDEAFPSPEDTKTHAFVRNLSGDPNAVTVDTLVARGAGVPVDAGGKVTLTKARYRLVAADIRAVARKLGWEPRQVMAAAWTGWGGSGELRLATKQERKVRKNSRRGRRPSSELVIEGRYDGGRWEDYEESFPVTADGRAACRKSIAAHRAWHRKRYGAAAELYEFRAVVRKIGDEHGRVVRANRKRRNGEPREDYLAIARMYRSMGKNKLAKEYELKAMYLRKNKGR